MTRLRAVEWAKTSLIVLLTVSAVFLAYRSGLFNDFFSAAPLFESVAGLVRGTSGTSEPSGSAIKEAARPLVIVITGEGGWRYGVKYDTESRNALYDRTSSILGEALGSAAQPNEVSEEEWRTALTGPGVFFEYIMPVNLSVLDGWLGVRMSLAEENVPLRRILVSFGTERNRIYYQNGDNGLFFGADTASTAGIAQDLESHSSNGAFFAFETDIAGSAHAPYMLIMPGNEHPNLSAALPGGPGEPMDEVLAALGHGNEEYAEYISEGMLVRVGTQFNIRADANGRVIYRPIDWITYRGEAPAFSEREMIEIARVVVGDTIGIASGDAEVFFESLEHDAMGSGVVSFGYYISGGRIFLHEDKPAARVTITSGLVSEIELNLVSFSLTGGLTWLLPERLALAAAGGEFILSYSHTGYEMLQPSWVKHES